jgi:hypothetical protein
VGEGGEESLMWNATKGVANIEPGEAQGRGCRLASLTMDSRRKACS